MGSVYLAEQTFMGWRAAVKILHRALADEKVLVTRFLNEGRAAKSISHPNVIEIIDVGILDSGLPYLLMELLEGETLGARIKRLGKLGVQASLEIASQAAAGLTAAHEAGVIHRDLKPDNLFLVPDPDRPGQEKVKVLDFGIAKLCDDGTEGPRPRTKHGVLLGTPAYMSPEQCRGVPVDHRCDVYALAIILYEMLAGQPPFVGTGQGDLLLMQVEAPPPPVRVASPEVPQFVEAAILRALAKQREQRFSTMREMGEALAGQHQPTQELPLHRVQPSLETTRPITPIAPMSWPTTGTRPSQVLRKQVRGVIVGALVVVPALILIASDAVRSPDPPAPSIPAALPRERRGGLRPAPPLESEPGPEPERAPTRIAAPAAPRARTPPRAAETPPAETRPSADAVTVRVLNPPIGLTVRVDGRPASLPLHLPRDGRAHRLQFAAPKFAPEKRVVYADQNQVLNLENTPIITLD